MSAELTPAEVIEQTQASNPVTSAMHEHLDGRAQEQLGSTAIANTLSSALDLVSAEYLRTPMEDHPGRGVNLRALFMRVQEAKGIAEWLADYDQKVAEEDTHS